MKVLTKEGWKRFDVEPEVGNIYYEFEKGVRDGDRSVYEPAVRAFKEKWDISPAQEAAIRIVLSDTEVLYKGCESTIIRGWHSAAAANILQCIKDDNWPMVNFFLTERARTVRFLDQTKDSKYYKIVDGKEVEISVEDFMGINN